MKYLQFVFITIISGMTLSACMLDDEDCPTGKAIVTVADKNYSNIKEINQATPLSEDLPMISYVQDPDLLWDNLCLKTTGEMPIVLTSAEKTYTLDLSGLKKGKYDFFIASGNTIAEATIDKPTRKIELHPNNKEHKDIYSGMSSFKLPLQSDQTIQLFRLKGKLLVVFTELPAQISNIEIVAENVSKAALKKLQYEGTTTVNKSFVRSSAPIGEFLLAPSASPNQTKLTVILKNGSTTTTTISNIMLKMERNKLSVIKPIYNPGTGDWEIEALIDGTWQQITDLDIILN